MFNASGKFPEHEEAFRHPTFMGNCPTIVTSVSTIYPVDEFHFLFLLFLTPSLRPMAEFSMYGVFVDDYMMVGFCCGLMLLLTLGVDFESTCTV